MLEQHGPTGQGSPKAFQGTGALDMVLDTEGV